MACLRHGFDPSSTWLHAPPAVVQKCFFEVFGHWFLCRVKRFIFCLFWCVVIRNWPDSMWRFFSLTSCSLSLLCADWLSIHQKQTQHVFEAGWRDGSGTLVVLLEESQPFCRKATISSGGRDMAIMWHRLHSDRFWRSTINHRFGPQCRGLYLCLEHKTPWNNEELIFYLLDPLAFFLPHSVSTLHDHSCSLSLFPLSVSVKWT